LAPVASRCCIAAKWARNTRLSNIVYGMIDIYYVLIMELRHLRYFVRVAEDLHFARAAKHLGISQPPLSQQIRALEDELEVRLLDRTSRSVRLTPAGRAFLDAARETLRQAEHAMSVARGAARGELGELAIGFNASAPFIPEIARAIAEFRRAFPDVKLVLREGSGVAQIEEIEDRVIDIGFMRSREIPDLPRDLIAQPFLRERLFVAAPPDHRLANMDEVRLADLSGEPMVFYSTSRSMFTGELIALMRERGVEPNIAQVVSDVSMLFGLTAAGIGVMVLAESLCNLQSAALAYRPLTDVTMMLWLVHHRTDLTLTGRNFLKMLVRPAGEAAAA
jgi:DNA-binding transcriptional LysR family regulator